MARRGSAASARPGPTCSRFVISSSRSTGTPERAQVLGHAVERRRPRDHDPRLEARAVHAPRQLGDDLLGPPVRPPRLDEEHGNARPRRLRRGRSSGSGAGTKELIGLHQLAPGCTPRRSPRGSAPGCRPPSTRAAPDRRAAGRSSPPGRPSRSASRRARPRRPSSASRAGRTTTIGLPIAMYSRILFMVDTSLSGFFGIGADAHVGGRQDRLDVVVGDAPGEVHDVVEAELLRQRDADRRTSRPSRSA